MSTVTITLRKARPEEGIGWVLETSDGRTNREVIRYRADYCFREATGNWPAFEIPVTAPMTGRWFIYG